MPDLGTVRSWYSEQGWGVVDSDATPGGCWVHYSAVATRGFRRLAPGEEVELEWEPATQDGYSYRATAVWPRGQGPEWPPVAEGPSSAYRSRVTIRLDQE